MLTTKPQLCKISFRALETEKYPLKRLQVKERRQTTPFKPTNARSAGVQPSKSNTALSEACRQIYRIKDKEPIISAFFMP